MAIVDDSKTPAVKMAQLVPTLIGTYSQLVSQIQQMGRRVYADGPDAAISNVQAMNTNAVAIFSLASIFQSAINAAAPILGKPAISVMPTGYMFTPSTSGDGSGTLTYTAPSPAPANASNNVKIADATK